MTIEIIYVPLLDENVEVWRPVEAVPLGEDLYRILSPPDETEKWQFPTGSVVRCKLRQFDEGKRLVAFERIPDG